MNQEFAALVEHLHPAYERLISCAPVSQGAVPDFGAAAGQDVRGVYLFTDATSGEHLYVGRTNRMRARYKNHISKAASEREAAFAFRLARKATGFLKPTYKTGPGSRKALASDPIFQKAFWDAKDRVRGMEFRWVEEADALRQCLLEVYVAVVLKTRHNDFDNH